MEKDKKEKVFNCQGAQCLSSVSLEGHSLGCCIFLSDRMSPSSFQRTKKGIFLDTFIDCPKNNMNIYKKFKMETLTVIADATVSVGLYGQIHILNV